VAWRQLSSRLAGMAPAATPGGVPSLKFIVVGDSGARSQAPDTSAGEQQAVCRTAPAAMLSLGCCRIPLRQAGTPPHRLPHPTPLQPLARRASSCGI